MANMNHVAAFMADRPAVGKKFFKQFLVVICRLSNRFSWQLRGIGSGIDDQYSLGLLNAVPTRHHEIQLSHVCQTSHLLLHAA